MGSKTKIVYRDIAPGAAEAAVPTATEQSSLSDLDKLTADLGLSKKISVFEQNYWTLDGTARLTDGAPFSAYVSKSISDADCILSPTPVITISFSGHFAAPGITIDFDTASGEWCSEINVKWYNGSVLRANADYKPNAPSYFCEHSVSNFNKIVITIKKTSLPYRRAKISRILIGAIRAFGMEEIRDASITKETNLIGLELPIGVMKWTLDNRDNIDFLFQTRQPVEVYNDGAVIGVFYITKAVRSSANLYSIDCEDAVGVLNDTPFSGGAYLEGISAKNLIESIIDSEFDVVFDVNDKTLKGVLQSGTKRDALQQILFALGAVAVGDKEKIHIIYPDYSLSQISEDRVYTEVTVDKEPAVTKVQIDTHKYEQSDNGGVEINGTKYSDTVSTKERSNSDVTSNSKSNVKAVSGATLVSADLANEVLDRLESYYFVQRTGTGKIVWRGEELGDYVSMPDAWGGKTVGHISKMEITLSNTVAANITVIETGI